MFRPETPIQGLSMMGRAQRLASGWVCLMLVGFAGAAMAGEPGEAAGLANRNDFETETETEIETGIENGVAAVVQDGAHESTCAEGEADKMALRIQARYDGIRDIHSNFEQRNESATFAGQPIMATEPKAGRVVFAKPGKMRWTYLEPEPSEVVSNGSILWIHDVEGQSITRLEVTAGFLSGAALQFLLGDGQILETFDVRAASCEAGRVRLELLPKAEATYEKLGLVADPVTGQLLATSVLDLFGNRTEIRFSDTRINLDPGDELFEMEIPEGVELIDYATYGAEGSD